MLAKVRQSNFELLRLVSQYLIIYYHLLLIFVVPFNDNPVFKALELPAHIGVILFVLISGYFGIHPTYKGFLKLISIFLIYSLPEICFKVLYADTWKELFRSFLFFTHTHFWFIRTYVFLYLLSPMVNHYLKNITGKQRIFMLFILFFISIYTGTSGGDPTLSNGKNAINFIFIYMIGDSLRRYEILIDKLLGGVKNITIIYVALNLLLVIGYINCSDNIIGKVLWRLSFPYSSPILLINSILFFSIFTKLSFQSTRINWLAKSSLAIYLIHANRPLFIDLDGILENLPGGLIGYTVQSISNAVNCDALLGVSLLGVTLLIMCIAIGIDKLLSPVWKTVDDLLDKMKLRLND